MRYIISFYKKYKAMGNEIKAAYGNLTWQSYIRYCNEVRQCTKEDYQGGKERG